MKRSKIGKSLKKQKVWTRIEFFWLHNDNGMWSIFLLSFRYFHLSQSKNLTFYSCFYAIDCYVFISNTYAAKWLKWKGVRHASLSKSRKFEQELIFFGCTMTVVCEVFFTKLSVIFILLDKKKSTFYSYFYAIDFCVFIFLKFSLILNLILFTSMKG